MLRYKEKPNFAVENEISNPSSVNLGTAPAKAESSVVRTAK